MKQKLKCSLQQYAVCMVIIWFYSISCYFGNVYCCMMNDILVCLNFFAITYNVVTGIHIYVFKFKANLHVILYAIVVGTGIDKIYNSTME